MRRYWVAVVMGAVFTPAAYAQYDGPGVEIVYQHGFTGPDRPVMEGLVREFNEAHPNITVRSEATPWDNLYQQLGPLVAAGRAPDVVAFHEGEVGRWMASGAVTELTPEVLADMEVEPSRFYESVWNAGTFEGRVYGLPVNNAMMAMFYNRDLLEQMGVGEIPTDRESYLEAARQCTTDASGNRPGDPGFDPENLATWGAGIGTGGWGSFLAYGALRGNGGNLVDEDFDPIFNSSEAVEAVQFLADLRLNSGTGPTDATGESENAAFRQGQSCFNFDGIWILSQYRETDGLNLGVAPVPQFGTERAAVWGASVTLGLPVQRSVDENRQAAALTFINWMTRPEQNLTWTSSGSLPTQPVVADNEVYEGNPARGLFDSLDNAYIVTGWPWVGAVMGNFEDAIDQVFLGQRGVEEALNDGVARAEAEVAEARQRLGME